MPGFYRHDGAFLHSDITSGLGRGQQVIVPEKWTLVWRRLECRTGGSVVLPRSLKWCSPFCQARKLAWGARLGLWVACGLLTPLLRPPSPGARPRQDGRHQQ